MENCDIFPICQLNVFCQKLQHIFLCCVLCQQQKKEKRIQYMSSAFTYFTVLFYSLFMSLFLSISLS